MIYFKMNILTGMCYPEYKSDEGFETLDNPIRKRMKSPFTQLRLGELYGDGVNDLTGYIMSVNYNFPDESTWEHSNGARVPKLVDVTLAYRVTHLEVPHAYSQFFGIRNSLAMGRKFAPGVNVPHWLTQQYDEAFAGITWSEDLNGVGMDDGKKQAMEHFGLDMSDLEGANP
jgi:hypothetical protein